MAIAVPEHHGSSTDEKEMLQATVSYCDVPDAYENFLADYYASAETESLYASTIDQAIAFGAEEAEFHSETMSPLAPDNVDR